MSRTARAAKPKQLNTVVRPTKVPNPESQLRSPCRALAQVAGEYSIMRRGRKGAKNRTAVRCALPRCHKRQFDVVMAWSVDRLGRSLQDLVTFLSELHALKVDLFLHQQGLDTTTPAGKAMFQMLGVFAEFERSIIQERVRAGLARAKSEGKTLGRPRIAADVETAVRATLANGTGMMKAGKMHGVGVGTVVRISRAIP